MYLKFKIAPKSADKDKWSTTGIQRNYLIKFLEEMLQTLENKTIPLAGWKLANKKIKIL